MLQESLDSINNKRCQLISFWTHLKMNQVNMMLYIVE